MRKYNVGGITFYEISGAGRTKRDAVPEMVRSYMTGRTIVPDSAVNQIVDDISNSLGLHAGKEAYGMIFVNGVSDACEIGTKQRGEAVLTSK